MEVSIVSLEALNAEYLKQEKLVNKLFIKDYGYDISKYKGLKPSEKYIKAKKKLEEISDKYDSLIDIKISNWSLSEDVKTIIESYPLERKISLLSTKYFLTIKQWDDKYRHWRVGINWDYKKGEVETFLLEQPLLEQALNKIFIFLDVDGHGWSKAIKKAEEQGLVKTWDEQEEILGQL